MSVKNLGRGLSALLGEDEIQEAPQGIQTLPVADLETSPYQPRRVFNQDAIDDLVESVRTKGVLQPLIVRPRNDLSGKYEIVGGERRWRAAQIAGLTEVPVVIKKLSDREALEVALIENLQRQDLNALEEAEGYRRLMDEFANTQEELAKALGKSRSHIANTLRLLGLPEKVKGLLEDGRLTSGHARALLMAKNPEALAQTVIQKGLNVRQTEKLVQEDTPKKKKEIAPVVKKAEKNNEDCDALAETLSRILGVAVAIKPKAAGGEVVLTYKTLEQLDDLIRRLTSRPNPAQRKENSEIPSVEEEIIQAGAENAEDVIFDPSFSDELGDDIISLPPEEKI